MIQLLSFITSFVIVLMMTPPLIRIAKERRIFDQPGERKLHTAPTPLLGGISIFSAMLISFLFWGAGTFELPVSFVLVSLAVLFFTGFVDDLRPLAPAVKFFMQIISVFITVAFSGNDIHGLHGLLGIHSLSEISSVIVSLLFVMMLINAFNFIDGVDGLAATTGFLAALFFGISFLSMNDSLFAVLAFSLAGALCAFLIFNFYPAKIFMGDTGTLVSGYVFALLAIRLTEETRTTSSSIHSLNYQSAPVFALSFLIIPTVDFFRVTTLRLLKGRSPVRADNNHIHHMLVNLGLKHFQVTVLLAIVNLCFIASAFFLRNVNQSSLFFGMLLCGILLSQVPYLIMKRKGAQIRL